MAWMIYGAYGFSGVLLAEEAVRRGHRPVLAGRSADKLAPLAARLGLDHVAFALDDLRGVTKALESVELVLNAAGPFVHTAAPMLKACTLVGVNYLDITGEYTVLENTFTFDEAARRQQVALISGVGFDVVPSDCLAVYVAGQVPGAQRLDIGIATEHTRMTRGTAQSGVQLLATGGVVRRGGQLTPYTIGTGARSIPYPHGDQPSLPIPWGDLATAYRSTGIPNITVYAVVPRPVSLLARAAGPLIETLIGMPPVQALANSIVNIIMRGPDEAMQQGGKAYVWAQAADEAGNTAQAWLETVEPYRFTALAGVRCVEQVLDTRPAGALTPAQAFGADFVLQIEGTRRVDAI